MNTRVVGGGGGGVGGLIGTASSASHGAEGDGIVGFKENLRVAKEKNFNKIVIKKKKKYFDNCWQQSIAVFISMFDLICRLVATLNLTLIFRY